MELPTDMIKCGIELPRRVVELLDDWKTRGGSKQGAVRCALYWYINRLSPDERAQAERETAEWLKTGVVPVGGIAMEAESALNASQAQESKPTDRKSSGNAKG